MAFPSRNDILIGISFVFFGVLFALCDRWQVTERFKGRGSTHTFDHLAFMWTLKQCCQLVLFFIWVAIDRNWVGCGRFKHGYIVHDTHVQGRMLDNQIFHDNPLTINNDEDVGVGNGYDRDVIVAVNNNPHQSINDNNDVDNDNSDDELIELPDEMRHRRRQRINSPSVFIYLAPAVLAQADVLLMYFGLNLTYGSSFIMLKGTVTVFTALLSMAFLAQQLACYVWFGVLVAALGFAVSGISDYVRTPSGGYEKYGIAAGDLLIVMAQIMFATKIIYEEKFIRKHSVHPMKFLGCEAFYGIIMAVVFTVTFMFVDGSQYSNLPNQKLEDIIDALHQLKSWKLIIAVLGSLFCYILYTYLGLFLVRDHGALPRIMIETFVWGIYWAVCLVLGWQQFFIAQVPGLCVIAIGTLLYSHILVLPCMSRLEGIDKTVAGLREHFMNLDRRGEQGNFRQNDVLAEEHENEGGDENGMPGRDNEYGVPGRDNENGMPGRDNENGMPRRDHENGMLGRDNENGIHGRDNENHGPGRNNEAERQRVGNDFLPQKVTVELHHCNGEKQHEGGIV